MKVLCREKKVIILHKDQNMVKEIKIGSLLSSHYMLSDA
jgi:hypothetical protein